MLPSLKNEEVNEREICGHLCHKLFGVDFFVISQEKER